MGCLGLFLLILVTIPAFFALIFLNIITISLGKLGLSPGAGLALLFAMMLGGMVNIPISHRRIMRKTSRPLYSLFFYYTPPVVTHQIIAVNLGGAIIPACFAFYLVQRSPLVPVFLATTVMAIVTRWLSRPIQGIGITMPFWIPPLFSAVLALLLARDNPAPVAYISGVLGTLIGADLLNWPNFRKFGSQVISIGGAGIFDGIFLTGIVAALIA